MKKSNTVRRTNLANNSKTPTSGAQSEQTHPKLNLKISNETSRFLECFNTLSLLYNQLFEAYESMYDFETADEFMTEKYSPASEEIYSFIKDCAWTSIENNFYVVQSKDIKFGQFRKKL